MKAACPAVLLLALCGCQSAPVEYRHNRWDYWSFAKRFADLPEPNYLPWALHRELLPDGKEGLVVCRWADDALPLRYFVEPPVIPESLAGEWAERRPEDYVTAVDEAFALWQRALGGPARFQSVASRKEAQVTIHLAAEVEEVEEGQVLGVVHGEAERCTVTKAGPGADQVQIRFAPHDASVFIADSVGLLTPRQVRAVALHEIGHVLGVSGQHSPLAGDVMFPVAGDRRIEALSEHDKNTLRALYSLPPGTIYARLAEVQPPKIGAVRREPPTLAGETIDPRHGFEVHFPKGWQVIKTPSGWIAVDGVSWDYDASIQVVASRGDVGSHLSLLAGRSRARGDDVRREVFELDGETVARLIARGPERAEQSDVVDWGDGFVLVVMADAATKDFEFYRPWFQRVLLSVQHIDSPVTRKPKASR
ncbi:MAG TPA: matrixin family metalloprotease [Myxococcota bacterium]|nr:matrixin family metalloprotease [Myxococcota bacterium]